MSGLAHCCRMLLVQIGVLLAGLATLAAPARAVSEADLLPVDRAFVLSARVLAHDRIEIDWTIAKGYYLYRERMGASADAAFGTGELRLPAGLAKHDPFFGDVQIYHDRVLASFTGTPAADVRAVDVTVKYQGCADAGVCYPPQRRTLHLALPAAAEGLPGSAPTASTGSLRALVASGASTGIDPEALPAEQAFVFDAIVDTPDRLLLRFTPAHGYYLYRDRTTLATRGAGTLVLPGQPQWPAAKAYHDDHFGDVAVYFEAVDVPLPIQRQSTRAQAVTVNATFQGCKIDGICYPPMQRSVTVQLPAGGNATAMQQLLPGGVTRDLPGDAGAGTNTTPGTASLWLALLLAVGGGLILNLMPCVLPVLSLKAISLVEAGESRARARAHALWYTGGVLASFVALGAIAITLRHAGMALGWGFQLQQPVVVGALAYVMLTVGLALSGVIELGAGWAGVGQGLAGRAGAVGDFFTGALAVVVASPCTAPLMGSALAYAFAVPTLQAMAVFVALGLGLALPMLLIGFVPALAGRLPKPGAWTQTLKQVLAFPMYLTAAWLVSVLASQRGSAGVLYVLTGAVALALALWLWERGRYARRGALVRGLAAVVMAAAIVPLVALRGLPPPVTAVAQAGTVPYSAEALQQLRREGRVVFVDVTADWCITCKANERAVLSRPAFAAALRQADAVYMVGDYTNVDPAITAFLAEHHAVGIPLYVVYPRGGGPGEVLPNILTQSIVDGALKRAMR